MNTTYYQSLLVEIADCQAAIKQADDYAAGVLLGDLRKLMAEVYQLHIDGQEPALFPFIDEAIDQGQRRSGKFTIWYGNLFCCVSHPDLGLIYSEEYKAQYMRQQAAYQRVAG